MQIRVLIVEDQVPLAENLIEYLDGGCYELDYASGGLVALDLVATYTYDVIVLDVMLPDISGFELCRRIREELRCNAAIIFMTARGDLPDKEEGFRLGGDDYLVKPFALKELQLRIDALARRRSAVSGELQVGELRYDPDTLLLSFGDALPIELVGISSKIMALLIRSYPRFVSYENLSREIWGTDDGDAHTLRTHVYALRKLLTTAFGQSLVGTVHGRGYRLLLPNR